MSKHTHIQLVPSRNAPASVVPQGRRACSGTRRLHCLALCVVLVCALSLQGCKTIAGAITGYPASFLDYKQTFDNSIGKGCYTVSSSAGFDPAGASSTFHLTFVDALGNERKQCQFNRIVVDTDEDWEAGLAWIVTKCALQLASKQIGAVEGRDGAGYYGIAYLDWLVESRDLIDPFMSDVEQLWTGKGEYFERKRFFNIASPERILDPENGLKLSRVTPRHLVDEWGVIVVFVVMAKGEYVEGKRVFELSDPENLKRLESEIEPLLKRAVNELDYPEMAVELSFGSLENTIVAYYDSATDGVAWMPFYDYMEQNGLEVCKF